MKKSAKHLVSIAALTLATGFAGQALATGMPSQAEMWQIIQRQQQEIESLKGQVTETQTEVQAVKEAAPVAGPNWSDKVSIGGVVEVEASHGDDGYGGPTASDIAVATVELSIDAQVNDWVNANVVLLYEDGATLDLDSATITIGNAERNPMFVTAGKTAVPFGNFSTNLVSDPVTLELGETVEDIVQVGFESNGINGSVYVFNGDVDKNGDDNVVAQFGANLGYSMETDSFGLEAGVSYISSLDDGDLVADTHGDVAVDERVGAWSVYGIATIGQFQLVGEYLAAAEEFDAAVTNLAGTKPEAWNVELAYSLELSGMETVLAVGYQGADDAAALGIPETKWLAAASVGIFENTSLAFEFAHSEDFEVAEGGTGDDMQTSTLQLGVEF
ncbi:MAG: LbtU family siderophore porin [Magnetococcales bacterium]|nr:LbtU family siderophore porin [Magnetococcales bacterium]